MCWIILCVWRGENSPFVRLEWFCGQMKMYDITYDFIWLYFYTSLTNGKIPEEDEPARAWKAINYPQIWKSHREPQQRLSLGFTRMFSSFLSIHAQPLIKWHLLERTTIIHPPVFVIFPTARKTSLMVWICLRDFLFPYLNRNIKVYHRGWEEPIMDDGMGHIEN